MIKIVFFVLFSIVFVGCSFKVAPNKWQYESANYFNLYQNNFLKDKKVLAKNDLKRAIQSAKRSANLTTLARVYLGECALNISVGIYDDCTKYIEISDVVNDLELDAYYAFIQKKVSQKQVTILPDDYKKFAVLQKNLEYEKASSFIFVTKKVTRSLLFASLIKENLSTEMVKKMISLASFHGYKKAVLFWLKEYRKKATDAEQIKIDKKIKILMSKTNDK